jgi:hypothetical protein
MKTKTLTFSGQINEYVTVQQDDGSIEVVINNAELRHILDNETEEEFHKRMIAKAIKNGEIVLESPFNDNTR